LLEYISLNESPLYWANKALSFANGYERQNMRHEIRQAGFDIKDVSKWLEEFYLEGA
jgi:hypothetical protein